MCGYVIPCVYNEILISIMLEAGGVYPEMSLILTCEADLLFMSCKRNAVAWIFFKDVSLSILEEKFSGTHVL